MVIIRDLYQESRSDSCFDNSLRDYFLVFTDNISRVQRIFI